MRPQREAEIEKAKELVEHHATAKRYETFTREEAEDKLGKSWTNLLDVYVSDDAPVRRLKLVIEALGRFGFVHSLCYDNDDSIMIEVSTSYHVTQKVDPYETS